jgi:CheY-like chemotaxis protein
LVEDEQGVRSLVRRTLESLGYKVLEAPDPVHALANIQQSSEPIQLLLTDLVMPQMSGKELAKRLTASCPKLRVLYMSGYTDDAVVRHGILEAGLPFLQKPFMPAALARKVREVLDFRAEPQ